jgi:hypothetical protein
MSSTPMLSEEEIRVARFAGSTLQLASGILAILSVFTVWWTLTATGVNTQYFPGPSYKSNGTFHSYASAGFGPVGGFFDAILILGIVAGAVVLVGAGLMLVATARRRTPSSGRMAGLVIAGVVIEAVTVGVPAFLLPWAFHDSSAGTAFCSGWTGVSPCSRAWGSGTHAALGYSFILADGWIIMIGALALGVLGLVIWRLGRN